MLEVDLKWSHKRRIYLFFSFFSSLGNGRGTCPVGKVPGHETWVLQVLELAFLPLSKLIPEDVPVAVTWPLLPQLSAGPLFLLPTVLQCLLWPDCAYGAGKAIRPRAPPARVAPWGPCTEISSVLCRMLCSSAERSQWGWIEVIRWSGLLKVSSECKSNPQNQFHSPIAHVKSPQVCSERLSQTEFWKNLLGKRQGQCWAKPEVFCV